MATQIVEQAFIDFLKAAVTSTVPETGALKYPAFAAPTGKTFGFYTSDEAGTFKLPNMSAEMPESTPLMSGSRAGKGILTIWVETQVDDEPDVATHNARVEAVAEILKNTVTVSAAISVGGKVKIYGYALGKTSRDLKDRHRTFGQDLEVGFCPRPPTA